MYRTLALILLVTLAMPASAASLSFFDLPSGFLQRITDGEIEVFFDDNFSIQSQFETNGFAAYPYLTATGAHFLLQYDIAPGSRCCGGNASEASGSVFLGVALTYDLNTDGHEIDIYFDGLIPDVGEYLFFSGQPQTTVIMDASAIAANQGVYMAGGKAGDYALSGNMSFGALFGYNHPFICIECAMVFELNLVYLDYSSGVLAFNPDDPRAVLIEAYDSYETTPYGLDMYIAVQPVPLPGALILFTSAILGLRLTGHRQRRAAAPMPDAPGRSCRNHDPAATHPGR